MNDIPLQADANMLDPAEHLTWALVALPGPGGDAPLVVPPAALANWSAHLYRCGFRHHPEHQEIKYVPPQLGGDWMQAPGGRWVPIDEELPPEVTAPDVSALSVEEKRVLFEALAAELEAGSAAPPEDRAIVVEDEPVRPPLLEELDNDAGNLPEED